MNPTAAENPQGSLSDQDVKAIRSRFPVFKKKVYLNSCSQGALCDLVKLSLEEHTQSWDELGSPWDTWVEKYELARSAFAKFINAHPDEVAVVPSASAGINAVASAFNYRERKKVIMGEFEFPTMGQIWLAQRNRGAEVQFIPSVSNCIPPQSYEKSINRECLIVPLTHVCFMNGHRSDVSAITQIAHQRGALVMLDDYQDCGTRPVDVKRQELDFYVSGALKYLLAPSGIAFLYVRRDLINSLQPTITGWFGQTNPFAFDLKHFDPAMNARRFEAGSPPVPQAYAVLAALELLTAIGPDKIAAHIEALTQAYLQGARNLRIKSKTPLNCQGPLVVLQMKDAEAVVRELARNAIVASNRMDGLRISFHVYNTLEDVHTVLHVLEKNLDLAVRDFSSDAASQ
jgi:selenocysteine lyase/cysteine desulfurase